jgi:nucleoside-diphosphate-sugar epimerase
MILRSIDSIEVRSGNMFDFLITGGLGFQGSHLTKALLKEGASVNILARNSEHAQRNYDVLFNEADNLCNLRVTWGDLIPETLRTSARVSGCIIHLAAQINVDESINHPDRSVTNNVIGTFNVLEAARLTATPVIYASSCEVYGSNTSDKPMPESHPMNPQSPYAATKAGADRLAYSYFCSYALPVAIMRPGNVFGWGQKSKATGAVIPRWISAASKGEPITVYGDGKQGRDFVYISDVVNGYLRVAKDPAKFAGEVFNLGTGKNTPMIDVAMAIQHHTDAPITFGEARPGEVMSFALDSSHARDVLGWVPYVDIKSGIAMTIDEAKRKGGF